jgi:hypothetical protein
MRSTLLLAVAATLSTAPLAGCALLGADDAPPASPDGGLGSACAETDDCGAGLVCAADVCISPGTVGIGGSCSANRDCRLGLQCATNGGVRPGRRRRGRQRVRVGRRLRQRPALRARRPGRHLPGRRRRRRRRGLRQLGRLPARPGLHDRRRVRSRRRRLPAVRRRRLRPRPEPVSRLLRGAATGAPPGRLLPPALPERRPGRGRRYPRPAIAITATGSSFTPAFSISATAIAPLVVTNPDRDLARDAPLDLTWTPPTGGSATEIFLKLDISHHGGSKGKIECTTADDGALTLSAAMVTELLDLGAAGFPTVILERRAVGSALTTAGRVDLMIGSEIERPVTVPGVISCDGDEDCTPPATCQSDLTCG